jgi:hypothetical protein
MPTGLVCLYLFYLGHVLFDQMNNLYRPTEVKSLEFKSLIGSVVPLVAIGNNIEYVATYYGWFKPPTQELVIKHFECVIKAYTQKENTDFLYISKEIWKIIVNIERIFCHILDKSFCLQDDFVARCMIVIYASRYSYNFFGYIILGFYP